MRVLHLVAGAGGMYCGSCLQGNTLVGALRKQGVDATLVPLYTPILTDEADQSLPRVAMGGVNVFLDQMLPLWRSAPYWVRRMLDRPALLLWAASRGGATNPEQVAGLCVSMLRGEEGRQHRELSRLIDWFACELRPDIVHLNNLLLVGVARQIRTRLGVPVVSSLAGEDLFLEGLPQPQRTEALLLLRERGGELDALIAPNTYFAEHMAQYVGLPRERIHIIPIGLDLDGHSRPDIERPPQPTSHARIGYLARICPAKGLHLLIEAIGLLVREGQLPEATAVVAGTLHPDDHRYLVEIERRVANEGLQERFQYLGQIDRAGKIGFLRSLDVFCLPTVYRESKGLPALEALANGVPVVLPAHGAFPEMIAEVGGGETFEPNSARSLADALMRVLGDREPFRKQALAAQRVVHQRFSADAMAHKIHSLYRHLLDESPPLERE
ncbi:MAG: glycosyltransferase family 4 protein [Planctomycetota bacterium]